MTSTMTERERGSLLRSPNKIIGAFGDIDTTAVSDIDN
jgi:hypothetical protein